MKTTITLCLIFIYFGLHAQVAESTQTSYDPKQQKANINDYSNVYQHDKSAQVIQSTGKHFSSEEISKMARRDVNGIASTVAGVDSRPGTNEVPSIRGADASGTAYFVDGVRVYGALPIITK